MDQNHQFKQPLMNLHAPLVSQIKVDRWIGHVKNVAKLSLSNPTMKPLILD